MKITRSQLQRIIKEELQQVMSEQGPQGPFSHPDRPYTLPDDPALRQTQAPAPQRSRPTPTRAQMSRRHDQDVIDAAAAMSQRTGQRVSPRAYARRMARGVEGYGDPSAVSAVRQPNIPLVDAPPESGVETTRQRLARGGETTRAAVQPSGESWQPVGHDRDTASPAGWSPSSAERDAGALASGATGESREQGLAYDTAAAAGLERSLPSPDVRADVLGMTTPTGRTRRSGESMGDRLTRRRGGRESASTASQRTAFQDAQRARAGRLEESLINDITESVLAKLTKR